MSGQERVIEARSICNRFGRQSVHENLDLDLYRGEILAVVGGSGSGKSVLLRSIVGLRRPDEGQIKVFGQDLAGLREEQRSLGLGESELRCCEPASAWIDIDFGVRRRENLSVR